MHTQSNIYPKRSLSQTSTTSTSSHTTQFSEKSHSKLSNPLSILFRSKSPAPIDIPKGQDTMSMSQPRDIPQRNRKPSYFPDQGYTSVSPQMSASMGSPKAGYPKRASTHTRKNSDDYKRYSGTVNHYGRHSNDWLFGGFSVRETFRDSLDRLRGQDKES
ncbi:hypothetical protein CBS147332_2866 [Penicillium roqueforti]|nr:hypothetical protein CBS147332_2866 [Penicillium roqueforti]KAI3125256.1 hypothetical protein CBS147331_250 [Penicillium roqueforti]